MRCKRKHQPQRTCIGCGNVEQKSTLVRIVRTSKGVQIDSTGKLSGRGAYLHACRSCWEKGVPKRLSYALRTNLTRDENERLQKYMLTLP